MHMYAFIDHWYNKSMNITKLGHCCLVLEDNGMKILTDPGNFTVEQVKAAQGINTILITHEHQDHFHVESVQAVLENNPGAAIVSNSAVAKLLAEKNIQCTVIGDTQSAEVNGMLIEGFGREHAPIYGAVGSVENTGYFVGNKFYFPGDAFYDPKKPIDVLALPTAGQWMKISETIDFAKQVKPRTAFPVHDGMIIPEFRGFMLSIMQNILKSDGIELVSIPDGESREF